MQLPRIPSETLMINKKQDENQENLTSVSIVLFQTIYIILLYFLFYF